jgi:Glycosyltransferase 61
MDRKLTLQTLENVILQGHTIYYPNVFLYSNSTLTMPINEKTMSLSLETNEFDTNFKLQLDTLKEVQTPVFFFIYNTDNYFHFLYDTLPILYQFFELRKIDSSIKLLMNPRRKYPFIYDSFKLLGITEDDVIIAERNVNYATIYVSNSLTHDGYSNEPPHRYIWSIYERMRNNAIEVPIKTPSKFYVSRRSWIHGDTSNIGTNYTTRRKMICEDELVELLMKHGYEEVFCEKLTMAEKIQYFWNATHIVGAIGGGMCNCVFAKPSCNVLSINSPEFDTINSRFLYTMKHTQLTQYKNTWICSNLYRRVKVGELIGEVIHIEDDILTINIGENITGWNLEDTYKQSKVHIKNVKFLDNGLNSPWCFSLDEIKWNM